MHSKELSSFQSSVDVVRLMKLTARWPVFITRFSNEKCLLNFRRETSGERNHLRAFIQL